MDAHRQAELIEFVATRRPALLRTALLLTGERGQAEDLVQSALERTLRHWDRICGDAPEAYVRRVMLNLYRSWWRRRSVSPQVLLLGFIPDRPGPDEPAGHAVREQVWSALRELPPRMRAVLVLRYYEHLNEAEIAQVLRCSKGTVKSQISRGLRRLRQVLEEPAEGDDLQTLTFEPARPQ